MTLPPSVAIVWFASVIVTVGPLVVQEGAGVYVVVLLAEPPGCPVAVAVTVVPVVFPLVAVVSVTVNEQAVLRPGATSTVPVQVVALTLNPAAAALVESDIDSGFVQPVPEYVFAIVTLYVTDPLSAAIVWFPSVIVTVGPPVVQPPASV